MLWARHLPRKEEDGAAITVAKIEPAGNTPVARPGRWCMNNFSLYFNGEGSGVAAS